MDLTPPRILDENACGTPMQWVPYDFRIFRCPGARRRIMARPRRPLREPQKNKSIWRVPPSESHRTKIASEETQTHSLKHSSYRVRRLPSEEENGCSFAVTRKNFVRRLAGAKRLVRGQFKPSEVEARRRGTAGESPRTRDRRFGRLY
jgi:hypothetical protein